MSDLTEAFDLTGLTISHHLRVLREAGLVDSQRRGTWVHYWIRPEVLRGTADVADDSAHGVEVLALGGGHGFAALG